MAEHNEEIKFYEKCLKAYRRARHWYNEYLQFDDFEGYRSGFVEMFSVATKELQKDYELTKSDTVGYYFYLIQIGFLNETGQYTQAKEHALKLINLVRDSKAIYRPITMGIAQINLADTLLYNMDPVGAMAAAQASQNHFTINTFNYSRTEEYEFWGLFYSGQYEKAEMKIKVILNNHNYKQSPFIENKRNYMYACTLFALGRLNECVKVLGTVKEIHVDKRGWNIGIRMLSLMVTLSNPDQEELTIHKIDALRKHIDSLKELKESRERDVTILRLLNDLMKYNYDFAKVYKLRENEFRRLESNAPGYVWMIKSHELIVFHIWFKCMVENKPYHLDITA